MSETARLVTGFAAGFLLLALVPSMVWPACRDLFDVGLAGEPATMASRKVEASALATLVGVVAVVGLACVLRPGMPFRPLALPRTVLAYAAWVPVWGLGVGIYLGALRAFDVVLDAQEPLRYLVREPASALGYWLVAATVAFGAPLAEELVFRGFLQPVLQQRLGRVRGLVVTSLFFGLGHGFAYALPIGLLGAFFGWLVQRHGSLLPAILAHSLHNSVTAAAMVAWPPLFDLMYTR
jgi:membrane protease YdiL (CAAX protease family)